MERLIYYPSFEVRDQDWLKFALLYIDKLQPIIPYSGDRYLSDEFRRLSDETDLLEPYRPDYEEGDKASLDAIDIVQKMIQRPSLFINALNDRNFLRRWRHPANQRYFLFGEKFNSQWNYFLQCEHLGKPVHDGILVAEDLGHIYMTILAQAIADRNDISSVTDRHELDDFGIFIRKASPAGPDSIDIARGILQLHLPGDFHNLPVSRVIQFRCKGGFKAKLHAFHKEIKIHMEAIESGRSASHFLQTRGNVLKDFSDEIASISSGVIPVIVGIWMLFAGNETSWNLPVERISAAGALVVSSLISVRNCWRHTQSRRFTRKYLADLTRVFEDYREPSRRSGTSALVRW